MPRPTPPGDTGRAPAPAREGRAVDVAGGHARPTASAPASCSRAWSASRRDGERPAPDRREALALQVDGVVARRGSCPQPRRCPRTRFSRRSGAARSDVERGRARARDAGRAPGRPCNSPAVRGRRPRARHRAIPPGARFATCGGPIPRVLAHRSDEVRFHALRPATLAAPSPPASPGRSGRCSSRARRRPPRRRDDRGRVGRAAPRRR